MRLTPKQLREKKGLSQSEAADAMNISRSYYNEIENGERVPSYKMAHKLARFYGVRIDQIIFPAFEYTECEQKEEVQSGPQNAVEETGTEAPEAAEAVV